MCIENFAELDIIEYCYISFEMIYKNKNSFASFYFFFITLFLYVKPK